jgi:hypothetical protein
MPVISCNLSLEAIAYLATLPGTNKSKKLDLVIKAHEYIAPRLQKEKALAELRAGASALGNLGFSLEAVQAYVLAAMVEVPGAPDA